MYLVFMDYTDAQQRELDEVDSSGSYEDFEAKLQAVIDDPRFDWMFSDDFLDDES